jgi:hypothetical protein
MRLDKSLFSLWIAKIHMPFSTGGKPTIHRLRKNRLPDKWFIGSELRVANERGKIVLDFNPPWPYTPITNRFWRLRCRRI